MPARTGGPRGRSRTRFGLGRGASGFGLGGSALRRRSRVGRAPRGGVAARGAVVARGHGPRVDGPRLRGGARVDRGVERRVRGASRRTSSTSSPSAASEPGGRNPSTRRKTRDPAAANDADATDAGAEGPGGHRRRSARGARPGAQRRTMLDMVDYYYNAWLTRAPTRRTTTDPIGPRGEAEEALARPSVNAAKVASAPARTRRRRNLPFRCPARSASERERSRSATTRAPRRRGGRGSGARGRSSSREARERRRRASEIADAARARAADLRGPRVATAAQRAERSGRHSRVAPRRRGRERSRGGRGFETRAVRAGREGADDVTVARARQGAEAAQPARDHGLHQQHEGRLQRGYVPRGDGDGRPNPLHAASRSTFTLAQRWSRTPRRTRAVRGGDPARRAIYFFICSTLRVFAAVKRLERDRPEGGEEATSRRSSSSPAARPVRLGVLPSATPQDDPARASTASSCSVPRSFASRSTPIFYRFIYETERDNGIADGRSSCSIIMTASRCLC